MYRVGGKFSFLSLTLGYVAAVFILSILPSASIPTSSVIMVSSHVQDLWHFPAYGLLCLCLIVTFRGYQVSHRGAVKAAILISAAFGLIMELFQAMVPGRDASLSDCFMNGAGILTVAVCYQILISIPSITKFSLSR